jgi:hypothetical protein
MTSQQAVGSQTIDGKLGAADELKALVFIPRKTGFDEKIFLKTCVCYDKIDSNRLSNSYDEEVSE